MDLLEIWLVFIVSNHFSFVSSLNEEGLALLSFKSSTFDSQGFLQNWNLSDATPCSWNGITCSEQRVVSLSIVDKKLSGTLHPALGKLGSLHHLSLQNNNLFGSFPTELYNLVELQSLDLSQNLFNGSIPDGFGSHLTSLQNLNLSFNVLHGLIPADFGNLSNLQGTLDLSHNVFTGPIPVSLSSLPTTLYIDLSYNNLSGSIPPQEALQNLGPTAYVGNAFLCGLPLNVSCSFVIPPPNHNPWFHCPSHGKGGKACSIITGSASIIVGFCLIILVVFWCKRAYPAKGSENLNGSCNFRQALMFKTEFSCFAKHEVEPLPENMDNYNFVLLDRQVDFDLEQLLKSSAYLLGKNGNGIVYKVFLERGLKLAVRRLEDGAYERFKEFQTEVEAIGKVRHPNIVALLAYCWSDEEKLLIHEYIPQGDLAIAIHGKAEISYFKPLSWSDRVKIMKGIAKGLTYLHEFSPRKYVHGDLKPTNILLGNNMEPYIADFGLGRLANAAGDFTGPPSEKTSTATPRRSPFRSNSMCSSLSIGSYYQAPEALKAGKPSQKWDVYSLGVILLEIITGKYPVIQWGSSEMELVEWVELGMDEGKRVLCMMDPSMCGEVEKEEAAAAIEIAVACTRKNPEKRPCMRIVSECLEKLGTSS
ncbi:putative inactive leucine-rich repeat receptor-like protein kinase [Cucumis melo var. makuwa]|nr:putative inactive leucine-rich repeat receptor-like protein kinase [Cucumis melo var. makuwa]TYK06697.1 putative inactive leucine-rich repeat receptor-like protein kinase [Cucumis melo var. makuwa]